MIEAALAPVVACASRTSRAWAREIAPDVAATTIAANSGAATTTGPSVALRRRRYSPVTQFATGFASSSGAAARVASNRAVASGSATSTAAS